MDKEKDCPKPITDLRTKKFWAVLFNLPCLENLHPVEEPDELLEVWVKSIIKSVEKGEIYLAEWVLGTSVKIWYVSGEPCST